MSPRQRHLCSKERPRHRRAGAPSTKCPIDSRHNHNGELHSELAQTQITAHDRLTPQHTLLKEINAARATPHAHNYLREATQTRHHRPTNANHRSRSTLNTLQQRIKQPGCDKQQEDDPTSTKPQRRTASTSASTPMCRRELGQTTCLANNLEAPTAFATDFRVDSGIRLRRL